MASPDTRTPSQVRKDEIINLVIRQTNYDIEQAKQELEQHNYDYLAVIKNYMNIPDKKQSIETSNKSLNQKIYSEIRNFLDTGVEKYERNKRITQRIQQVRQQQAKIVQQNANSNAEENNILETVNEEEEETNE